MLEKLYTYRFELFLFSQIAILFGSLVLPVDFFETFVSPVLFLINLMAGIILISEKKKLMWFLIALLIISGIIFGADLLERMRNKPLKLLNMATYFLFYSVVTFEIIRQVWITKIVNKTVIFGLISGYISLGLISFFICLSIELAHPGSFTGLLATVNQPEILTERLMYYSYITLLTIGYGEIVPITSLAQKAAILIGMMGQFYLVILTAVVVGKYINQKK
ncbi:two pore domain potassium channel family protein [Aquimarina mytili]|uniref:Two pore domain potassium channel family protein n=1 Tax=Aquimarina mytili TaxID=874423 RepID=A0A937A0T4_9FLAO|nr:two pore domain potassium channel family protein [Aquimarina mytili]MBL0682369.1 two pore domain potassium channel family protein [Aquimarina mytili]